MPAIPSIPPIPVRRGVTLLELLVVLVLMTVAAAVVLPALGVRVAPSESGFATDRARDAVIARARRLAVERGAPVQLRVAPDGLWALANLLDGNVLASGRLAEESQSAMPNPAPNVVSDPVDLFIDAMGSCLPAGDAGVNAVQVDTRSRSFDALTCRYDTGKRP